MNLACDNREGDESDEEGNDDAVGLDTSDDDEEEAPAPKKKKAKTVAKTTGTKKAAPKGKAKAKAKVGGKGKAVKADGPKRSTSAYLYFTADNRARVKSENPEMKLFELSKIFGAEWKQLSDAGKKKYNALAEKDKARYEKEKSKMKKGGKGKGGKAKAKAPKGKNADGTDKKPNTGGLNIPLLLSAELSALCGGASVLSRAECMRELWVYIKANDLQKAEDRRQIVCDSALLKITGGEQEIPHFSLCDLGRFSDQPCFWPCFRLMCFYSWFRSKHIGPHLTKPTGSAATPAAAAEPVNPFSNPFAVQEDELDL